MKEINKQKYKRCLAMARVCKLTAMLYARFPFHPSSEEDFNKWKIRHEKWLKIAENFKE